MQNKKKKKKKKKKDLFTRVDMIFGVFVCVSVCVCVV